MPDQGLFLPTTEIFDTKILQEETISQDQLREALINIVQAFNDSNTAVNFKDTGLYPREEYINGQLFFPNPTVTNGEFRQVFRTVVNCGALPNAGTLSVLHGITIDAVTQPIITFTRIYGTASDLTTPEYIPIPYCDTTAVANNIELYVNSTSVNIVTAIDYTRFTQCYVVLEYLKN